MTSLFHFFNSAGFVPYYRDSVSGEFAIEISFRTRDYYIVVKNDYTSDTSIRLDDTNLGVVSFHFQKDEKRIKKYKNKKKFIKHLVKLRRGCINT